MNDTTKIWVLSGVVTIVGFILIFLAKWFFYQVLGILKEIREELKNLTHVTTIQDIKLQNLEKDAANNTQRLDRHSNRIMDTEKRIFILEDKNPKQR